jgi:hypothetical protein
MRPRLRTLAIAAGTLTAAAAGAFCGSPQPQPAANQASGAASSAQSASAASAPSQPAQNMRLVDPQTATLGTPQRQGACTAVLPQGWTMTAAPYGDTTDLSGAGGRAHASWGIRGVNTAMQAYYGPMFGPPDTAVLATASTISQAQARFTSQSATVAGYFTATHFEAGNVVGTVLYHAYPAATPGQYVLSTYFAWVDRGATDLLPIAEAVLTTISCQTQLRPPPPSSTSSASNTSSAGSSGNDEDDRLKDYNMQLGTQWAHDGVGRNYLLDYASQWNDNGPDGPGYYVKNGNDVEKLTPGWGG